MSEVNVLTQVATTADEMSASKPPMYKEYDGFVFLPSFRESYDCLVNAGENETATLLLKAIVSYGTESAIITNDPRIEIVMTSIRRTIDKQRIKYKARKERH